MIAHIYALLEPETRKPRYVGHSRDVKARLRQHWMYRQGAIQKKNPQLVAWICSLDDPPEYFIFESVPWELRHKAEHYYTDLLRQIGMDLLNINSGGYLSAKHRAKLAAAGVAANTGRKQSPEERARRSGRSHTLEWKADMSAKMKGRYVSPDTRVKMAAARKAWWERKAQESA